MTVDETVTFFESIAKAIANDRVKDGTYKALAVVLYNEKELMVVGPEHAIESDIALLSMEATAQLMESVLRPAAAPEMIH